MASNDSQIDKSHHGHPKRAELPDVNINTGAQSINTEKASLNNNRSVFFQRGPHRNFAVGIRPSNHYLQRVVKTVLGQS